MPEASVSSIGSLGPTDFARVVVGMDRIKTESMTLCLPSVLWPSTVAKNLRQRGRSGVEWKEVKKLNKANEKYDFEL